MYEVPKADTTGVRYATDSLMPLIIINIFVNNYTPSVLFKTCNYHDETLKESVDNLLVVFSFHREF